MKSIRAIQPEKGEKSPQTYFFYLKNRKTALNPKLNKLAARIDTDGDGILSDRELSDYLVRDEVSILKHAPDPSRKGATNLYRLDQNQVLNEYKQSLYGKAQVPSGYHSYEEINQTLKDLAEKHPDKAQLISLGKTYEKRDIWALKIGNSGEKEGAPKPGLIITGATHAREWPTPEIALKVADGLLNEYQSDPAMKNRVDSTEIWIVPVANPDGFVFTQTKNNMWRKNRRPIEQTACDLLNNPQQLACELKDAKVRRYKQIKGIGVDLNRNFYDGNAEHFHLYRPKGDDPCSIWDDPRGTSDNPYDETYRGPAGNSEAETQALTELTLNTPNIEGCLDLHAYGGMILIPWGHTTQPVENQDEYLAIGRDMQKAMKTPYRLIASHELYPTYGSSNDLQHINGKIGMAMEVGASFQPQEKQLKQTVSEVSKAVFAFIDHFAEKKNHPQKEALPQ